MGTRIFGKGGVAACVAFALAVLLVGSISFVNASTGERIELAGSTYEIPKRYLRYPVGAKDKGLYIAASLANLTPVSQADQASLPPGWGDVLLILVHDARSTTDTQFRWHVSQGIYGPLKQVEPQFGLDTYLGGREGIAPRQHDPSVPLTLTYKTLYWHEAPPLFLTCDGDKAVPYPGCKQTFSEDGLLYEIDFGKQNLPKWVDIQQRAVELMRKFRVK
ncbi:MAG: hypothetical protein WDO17_15475 [Alphaproteobacteria bacterium]